jgi:hypothetical protein
MNRRASESAAPGMILPLQAPYPGFAGGEPGYLAFTDNRAYMTLKFLIG